MWASRSGTTATTGRTLNEVTTVEVGGSAPTTSTAARSRPISSSASRSALDEALARLGAAAGERDLAGVAAQVVAALGEDQAGPGRPAEERDEHRRALAAVGVQRLRLDRIEEGPPQVVRLAQMITWTVPPSTLQADPST